MAIITNLTVPYPDFKLHEVIDPEQFDFNNGAIVEKMNLVLAVINQITESVAQGGSGADKISITPILPFTSNKLQGFLLELISRLVSSSSNSGSSLIGTAPITGVGGTSVSSQLVSLKSLIDTEKARIDGLTTRMATVETNITNRYTKAEVDAKDTTLQSQINTNKTNITSLQTLTTSTDAKANSALSNSSFAVTTSNSANTKSDGAVSTANSALGVASGANTKSDSALSTANSANTKSDGATTTANTALTNSTVAVNDSTTALSASNQAFTKSESALLIAEGANVKSDQAVTTSNSASTVSNTNSARIDNLVSSVTVNGEVIDARVGADNVARATVGTLIREVHAQSVRKASVSTTLKTGVSTVTGEVDALAEAEIEGRTLISLGNSNLEATKQYVVADKKTKVIVDGVTQSGVAKFTKGTTTVSTANYVGKVLGSTVANPHIGYYYSSGMFSENTLPIPSGSKQEFAQVYYDRAKSLDGSLQISSILAVNKSAPNLFSFDIIAEIERKLGIIPKSTLAEKVQWVKDNGENLTANWHGFGSSPLGNKATLRIFDVVTGAWGAYAGINHTSASVTKLAYPIATPNIGTYIDTNGFVHYLAYADASDGVTASSISTDYIDLVVTLKATAQLNTRPTIIRVENFEGKVSGSVVENAHVVKGASISSLQTPTGTWSEFSTVDVDKVAKLDNSSKATITSLTIGLIAQHLFSFNLIEAIERNVGKIPRTSVADKVQWLKDNVARFTFNAHAFGSSPTGNKATLAVWYPPNSNYNSFGTFFNLTGVIAKITNMQTNMSGIDSSGFIHALLYAEPSDGTTASTINTDYIDLEIELKPNADFTRPKVALYEVTADSYAKILVDWNADEVVNRYPSVEGVQHLQGVGVIAEGENLLPPFTEWNLHPNAKVISPYELELNATAIHQGSYVEFPVVPSKNYNFMHTLGSGRYYYRFFDASNVAIGIDAILTTLGQNVSISITSPSNASKLRVTADNFTTTTGKFTFTNPMLTLGNVAKPFVPRNPSYLYADVKLGAIGTVADRLYEQDGAKFVRKVVEKDVVLGGDLGWAFGYDYVGFKLFTNTLGTGVFMTDVIDNVLIKNVGSRVKIGTNGFENTFDKARMASDGKLYITISDQDTGFGETYNPTTAEIKAYFYGYKMNNGVFGTNYDGTGTKTWIPIGDTTNARAVTVVPTSASPTQLDGTIQPYKLSYVLATPQVINVTDKVEGSLKVNGLTQVEVLSGIVRREKATFVKDIDTKWKTNHLFLSGTKFKNRLGIVITFYKNGISYKQYGLSIAGDSSANGKSFITIEDKDFDPTAEYTVTYIALDKPLLTANPVSVKLTYAINQAGALQGAIGRIENNTRDISNHDFFIDYVEAKTDNNRVDLTVAQTDIAGLKSSVSSGKTQLATAITGKGVASSGTDTFAVLATNINNISKGQGNAIEAQVLAPSTFSNADGVLRTGSMVNRGAVTIIPSDTIAQVIPAGYHNGSGTVAIGSRIAKGNVNSSESLVGFTNTSGANVNLPVVSAINLPFQPKTIVVHRGGYSVTTYSTGIDLFGTASNDVMLATTSGVVHMLRDTQTNLVPLVNSTAFNIPVSATNQLYFWVAYEF